MGIAVAVKLIPFNCCVILSNLAHIPPVPTLSHTNAAALEATGRWFADVSTDVAIAMAVASAVVVAATLAVVVAMAMLVTVAFSVPAWGWPWPGLWLWMCGRGL